jgi:hypothetical protein
MSAPFRKFATSKQVRAHPTWTPWFAGGHPRYELQMRRRCLFAFVLAVFALGCATERPVTWGEETAAEASNVVATPRTSAAPVTAEDYAARFTTDGECDSEARRIGIRAPELAIKLVRACVARGDFKRMAAIADAPWSALWAREKDAAEICARVVAARAGDVENDVKSCASVGIPVATLDDLFAQPDKARGRLTIFRGRIDPDLKDKSRVRLVETALESGVLETVPTGRRVAAIFGTNRRPATDAILLVTAISVSDDKVADDGEFVATVDVQSTFVPAAAPTF